MGQRLAMLTLTQLTRLAQTTAHNPAPEVTRSGRTDILLVTTPAVGVRNLLTYCPPNVPLTYRIYN